MTKTEKVPVGVVLGRAHWHSGWSLGPRLGFADSNSGCDAGELLWSDLLRADDFKQSDQDQHSRSTLYRVR